MSIWTNIRKRGLKDILSSKRRKIYRESQKQQKEGVHIPFDELLSYCEQVVYRNSLCSECSKAGTCKHCGCLTPHIYFVKENVCSGGNWQEMLSPQDWINFKEERKLEIGIKI